MPIVQMVLLFFLMESNLLGGSVFGWGQGFYPVFDSKESVVAALPCQFSEFACCPSGNCQASWGGKVLNTSLCLDG